MKHSASLIFFLAAMMAAPASAHHSLAEYETSNYRTMVGTVKEFIWANPHASLILVTEESQNEFTEWVFEGGSPGRLARGGFDENTIGPGDQITVAYHCNRDNSIGGFFLAVTRTNGDLFALPRFHGLSQE